MRPLALRPLPSASLVWRGAAVLAAVAMALALVVSAFAHAEPDTVSPGSGAVLVEPPAEIVIELSQETKRGPETGLDVFNAAGEEVTTVDGIVDNGNRRRLSVLMPRELEPGVYTVRWKTLSTDDGDPAEGEYQFTYDPAGTPDPGKTKLREDVLSPGGSPTTAPNAPVVIERGGGGTSWVLVAAVGVGMLTVGSGLTYLLVQKKG